MGKIRVWLALILSSIFLAGNLILDHDYFYFASFVVPYNTTLPPWGGPTAFMAIFSQPSGYTLKQIYGGRCGTCG